LIQTLNGLGYVLNRTVILYFLQFDRKPRHIQLLGQLGEAVGPVIKGTGMVQGLYVIYTEVLLTLTGVD
jgi:hypothetical protein